MCCAPTRPAPDQNKLTLGDPFSVNKISAEQVILFAALASRANNNDTIDLAVLGGLKNDQALKHIRSLISSRSTRCINAPRPPSRARTERRSSHEGRTAGDLGVIGKCRRGEARRRQGGQRLRGARLSFIGVARAEGDGQWQFLGVLPLFDPPRRMPRQPSRPRDR